MLQFLECEKGVDKSYSTLLMALQEFDEIKIIKVTRLGAYHVPGTMLLSESKSSPVIRS